MNLYDYHARQYEPAIGRFTSIDPLAEKSYPISPYAYCLNNPLKYIDPDGMIQRLALTNTVRFEKTGEENGIYYQAVKEKYTREGKTYTEAVAYKYDIGYIYLNNGGKIPAKRVSVHFYAEVEIVNGDFRLSSPLKKYPKEYDPTSNCHGYSLSLGLGNISIDNYEVAKIVRSDGRQVGDRIYSKKGQKASEIYEKNKKMYKSANLVIFYSREGTALHSSIINDDGTFSDSNGVEAIEKDKVYLDGGRYSASRGMDYEYMEFYNYSMYDID